MLLNYLNEIIFRLNMRLDDRNEASFTDVYDHIKTGDLFDWLSSEFGSDFSILLADGNENERDFIIEALQRHALEMKGRERRKFGVRNNGLSLLIALILNVIAMEKIDVVYYENFYNGRFIDEVEGSNRVN